MQVRDRHGRFATAARRVLRAVRRPGRADRAGLTARGRAQDRPARGKERPPAAAHRGVTLHLPDEDLVGWRRDRLEAAGFARELADAMARDRAMDLHALLELVDRGCPPRLAVRILAPLEGPRA
jgi:hypothetical protein